MSVSRDGVDHVSRVDSNVSEITMFFFSILLKFITMSLNKCFRFSLKVFLIL